MTESQGAWSMSAVFRLDGKRVLVSGAGRGLGRAAVEALAAAGAHVTLLARSADEIEALAKDLRGNGFRAEAHAMDVMDSAAFAAFVALRPAYDAFVNNAGTNRPAPFLEVSETDFDAIMDLNVRAAFFAAQAVARRMVETGTKGSIINVSSQMGHVGGAKRTVYCASKFAMEGFTKAMAIELGAHGIRVNTVCPTFIETPLTRPFLRDEAFRASVLSKIKLGRLGQPEEVASAIVFLASEASSLMTGSALMLDGGWTAE
jgi:NAD(P)-dependent dehydrogenase (short-subunit alcohol dehydrogenase family)